jgi:hypothetical protein
MLWLLDSLMWDMLCALEDLSDFLCRILGAMLAYLLLKILGKYWLGGLPSARS